jgi:hypothetical protein
VVARDAPDELAGLILAQRADDEQGQWGHLPRLWEVSWQH